MDDRRTALFLAGVLLLTLAGGCEPGTARPGGSGETARVNRTIDGDTVELSDGRRVRYLGINAPEVGEPGADEARAFNAEWVEGQEVWLETDVELLDAYGRTLSYVWVGDTFVNAELLRQGYAIAYTLPPNVRYTEQLLAAQQEARAAGRGLWAAADVPLAISGLNCDAAGQDQANLNDEWVAVTNEGTQPIDLTGYYVKDTGLNLYTFGALSLAPNATVTLHSGRGNDGATAVYWGQGGQGVWNNDGDTAFLRTPEGLLVDALDCP